MSHSTPSCFVIGTLAHNLTHNSEIGSSPIRLPKCNSMRTRPGRIEPEIYFRIVHVARNVHGSRPAAATQDQTIEIALESRGPLLMALSAS